MRLTYTALKEIFLDNIQQTDSADATLKAQFDRFLGPTYQLVRSKLGTFVTERTRTAATVAGQQYYHKPPGVSEIETMTYLEGSLRLPLRPIQSRQEWDRLNQVSISGTPRYYFQQVDDFGLYPIPSAVGALSLTFHGRDRNLSQEDYTTGSVAVENGSTTVTGTGTAFTPAMEGRWFCVADNGFWYRIAERVSDTEITLETAYDGPTETGKSYTIGETPELPEEGHILLADGVTAHWFAGVRKDYSASARWWNQFWTGDPANANRDTTRINGGLIGLQKATASRSSTSIVRRRRGRPTKDEELLIWGSSITE